MSNYHVSQAVGETTLVGIPVGSVTVFERDTTGKIMRAGGASVPNAVAGYAVGAVFVKTSGVRAGCMFVNTGSTTSCSFVRMSPPARTDWNFVDAKLTACSTGVTAFTTTTKAMVKVTDKVFASYGVSDDQDQIQLMSISAEDTILGKIVDPLNAHSIYWAVARQGAEPVFEVFAAGKHTTVGGNAAEALTVAGVLASDIVLASINTLGTGNRTLGKAVPTADTITFTFSDDPAANHVVNYIVLRPAGSFKPSHAIVACGTRVAIAGDTTTIPITVSGILTTDIPFAVISATDDTDSLITTKITAADTLTLTATADPVTDHSFTYFVLRAL